ncbi:23S rRNA (adenine(1618)-N(6))-methyltransferase RlmF [Flammeovirga pacifica]|uniref:23S rRNA (Adenine(1618)-N(6))-methyltransferase n=1 Tax=Flammeovirga pacifica TaxID=915059 RepID=A0A1S1YT94_FLAPC|nr:23S rRNA (adenine(1618)-N(6))-methyltransferase RlmF [Flammeovirga pacifica]OHX64252.1 23S rRNA (adenine(1618)-N(6))-methyltransferase [Flammeovirga pacifica]
MHHKNPHKSGYDIDKLCSQMPQLKSHIILTKGNTKSINFHDAESVKLLNKALLKAHYKIKFWDIPKGYLCPPVPGRLDYLLGINDLIKETTNLSYREIKGFDVGTGANLIYPLLGYSFLGWKFSASEIDDVAINNGINILRENKITPKQIHIKKQNDVNSILKGLIVASDRIAFTMCNPPFYKNEKEALDASRRKNKNLKQKNGENRNFGGLNNELWVEGGELEFIIKMIDESTSLKNEVIWFTSLVSNQDHILPLQKKLKKAKAHYRIIDMGQGQKKSRFIAWSYIKK